MLWIKKKEKKISTASDSVRDPPNEYLLIVGSLRINRVKNFRLLKKRKKKSFENCNENDFFCLMSWMKFWLKCKMQVHQKKIASDCCKKASKGLRKPQKASESLRKACCALKRHHFSFLHKIGLKSDKTTFWPLSPFFFSLLNPVSSFKRKASCVSKNAKAP